MHDDKLYRFYTAQLSSDMTSRKGSPDCIDHIGGIFLRPECVARLSSV